MAGTGRTHAPREQHGQPGFTLIELMVVILVVGLLAAIALPRLTQARERAFFSTIQQDFRNLGSAQERYHQLHLSYAQDLASLGFDPTVGVQVQVVEASSGGWSAQGTHESLGQARGCAVYLGDADPPSIPGGGSHTNGPGVVQCAGS